MHLYISLHIRQAALAYITFHCINLHSGPIGSFPYLYLSIFPCRRSKRRRLLEQEHENRIITRGE